MKPSVRNEGSSLVTTPMFASLKEKPWWRLETALIAGAVVVGLGSAALSEANRTAADRELRERFQIATLVVASKDLPAGSRLDPDAVKYAEVLRSQATPNAVDAETLKNVLGRTLTIELKAGDAVLLTAVEGAAPGSAVAAKIPPGKRLVTLQVKDKVAQKGWIKPNDHVDVIATMDLPGRGRTTFTLLEDVTLVSVGKASVWDNAQVVEGSEIGFYASPDDVAFVGFAEKTGEFSLALRNPQDIAKEGDRAKNLGSDGIDLNKFLDHASINKASGGGELPVFVKGQRENGSGEPKK